jgi:uncharacterized protein YfaS (alpha-2-macroglobulin family)
MFRESTRREAQARHLSGLVRNLHDGRVEAVFDGHEPDVQAMIQWCHRGPSRARVDNVQVDWETPGDEFDVSTGVANNVQGSGANARVRVTLAAASGLQVVGAPSQDVAVAEGREGTARFRVKALDRLGAGTLTFTTSLGAARATRTIDMSIRPATPYMSTLKAGVLPKGSAEVALDRALYPQYRSQKAGVSTLPLQFGHGFVGYLARYPYVCTEQLVSMAMPATLLASRPEFGYVRAQPGADVGGLVDELRQRQNDAGAYRLWPGADEVDDFVSIYAQHWLLEARERGQAVPDDLIRSGNACRSDGCNMPSSMPRRPNAIPTAASANATG